MGCGAALSATCPACQQANPPGARFCIACGNSLTASGQPASTPAAAPEPTSASDRATASPDSYTPDHLAAKILAARAGLEGERKQVTILFADVVGSTELIRDRDPEEAQELLDGALQVMMNAVHRYEGAVSRLMGDGLLALFGAPIAHEDHAVRACYTALAIQDGMRGYAEQARQRHDADVRVRVGLNSGEVVVRVVSDDLHMDYTALGQTVHLAARMEQSAAPGTIRLTTETLGLVEGYVQVRSLGSEAVKGLAEPVEIHELLSADVSRTRLQAAASRGLTRFVGRQAELAALQAAQGRARAGQGQIAALVGEPGVGKSRLVWEVTRGRADNGTASGTPDSESAVLEAGALSYGTSTPYLPIISLLKAWGQIEPSDDPSAVAEKLTDRLHALDPSLESVRSPLLALLDVPVEDVAWQGLDPPRRRRQTIDAVKRLLLRLSQRRPLLLVVEDLHWLDAESQALLDELVESLPTAGILLLVTYRPEYRHDWGSKTYYTQVRVDALPPGSAEELLRSLLGEDAALRPVKKHLIEHTDGNPFFLEESVRTLVETGALVGERGAYRLTQAVPGLRVPATVQTVLAARIDRLTPADKRLLQTAAVVGKDVPLMLLQSVAGLSEEELQGGLGRLRAAELMYEVRLFPELEYTFKHALTHEVAYGSLLQERRRTLHARIVEAIEQRYHGRLDEQVERLAHHAQRGEVWEKAVTYCQQAGLKAIARSANRDAIGYFEQALAALGHMPESRGTLQLAIDLRLDFRPALIPVGQFPTVLELLREAQDIAERLGDLHRLGRTLSFLLYSYFLLGEHERAIETGERALAIGRAVEDLPIQVVAAHLVAFPYRLRGDYRRAIEVSAWVATVVQGELVRERFGVGGYPASASRGVMAGCLAEVGEFAEGIAYGNEAIRIAEALDHPYGLGAVRLLQGYLYFRQGRLVEATSLLNECLELFERRDLPQLIPEVKALLGTAYVMSSQAASGIPLLEQATAQLDVQRIGNLIPHVTVLSEGYMLAERFDEASRLAGVALDGARQRKELGVQAECLRLLGEVACRRTPADFDLAEADYGQAVDLAEERGMRPLQAHCHLGLGKLLRRVGRLEEARVELARAVEMLREMQMVHWLPEAETELAEATST
jgi:class 3 adenylate cyclase/tetratricopeptide (TPR) repeat protein